MLFAVTRYFPLSLAFLFIAGGFQTTFLSATATILQLHADKSNRRLGPVGSFPSGLAVTAIGAPLGPSPFAVFYSLPQSFMLCFMVRACAMRSRARGCECAFDSSDGFETGTRESEPPILNLGCGRR